LSFKHKGVVNVPCDLTSEDFDLPVKGKMKLIVRFEKNLIMIMKNYYSFGEFEIDMHSISMK
jgi:hypothetical protein